MSKVSPNRKGKVTHSETYDNETYKSVKEGKNLRDSQGRQRVSAGKGDADRTRNKRVFRENYDEIFKKEDE
mgnify:CR=1 FL=1|jgi:hypothetical protein|tara:strand:+ start:865 stop:1077 length:213 start_codon:yes stop_codon:yes gene_type:complete